SVGRIYSHNWSKTNAPFCKTPKKFVPYLGHIIEDFKPRYEGTCIRQNITNTYSFGPGIFIGSNDNHSSMRRRPENEGDFFKLGLVERAPVRLQITEPYRDITRSHFISPFFPDQQSLPRAIALPQILRSSTGPPNTLVGHFAFSGVRFSIPGIQHRAYRRQ